MSGFLLDTNVVSEMTKNHPSPQVIAFLARTPDLWLAPLVVHELEFGLWLVPQGRRRDRLRADLSRFLTDYADRILPIDLAGAMWAARFRAHAVRSGRTPGVIDTLVAGTAKAHDLAIATRNVRDFEGLGVEVVNPWEPEYHHHVPTFIEHLLDIPKGGPEDLFDRLPLKLRDME